MDLEYLNSLIDKLADAGFEVDSFRNKLGRLDDVRKYSSQLAQEKYGEIASSLEGIINNLDKSKKVTDAQNAALNDLASNLEKVAAKADGAQRAFRALKLDIEDSTIMSKIMLEFDEKTAQTSFRTALVNITKNMTKFMSNDGIDLAQFITTDAVVKKLRETGSSLLGVEGRYKEMAGNVAQSLAGLNRSTGEAPGAPLMEQIGRTFDQTKEAVDRFGVAPAAARKELEGLLKSGLDIAEIDSIEIDTGRTEDNLKGVSAQMAIMMGMGLDSAKANDLLYRSLRRMGREGEDVSSILTAISRAQEGSGLSQEKVNDVLLKSASNFEYFGTKVENLTGLFKTFNEAMGKSKAALSADLFEKVAAGIGGMSEGMKGFIGLQSGLGQGGALSAILEYEDLIAEGDFAGLLEKVSGTIEQVSGSKILTREEARETGRDDTFFLQRKLFEQSLGIKDPGQIRELQNTLGRGDIFTAAQVMGGQEAQREALGALERRADTVSIAQVGGGLSKALNIIEAEGLPAVRAFSEGLHEAADSMVTDTVLLTESLREMAKIVAASVGREGPAPSEDDLKKAREAAAREEKTGVSVGKVVSGGIPLEVVETLSRRAESGMRSLQSNDILAARASEGLMSMESSEEGKPRMIPIERIEEGRRQAVAKQIGNSVSMFKERKEIKKEEFYDIINPAPESSSAEVSPAGDTKLRSTFEVEPLDVKLKLSLINDKLDISLAEEIMPLIVRKINEAGSQ